MNEVHYNDYLKSLEKVHAKHHKGDFEYLKRCKSSNSSQLKDFHIIGGHTLTEYFNKYYKKFKLGLLTAYKGNEAWLMSEKKKYWEIPNESSFRYFEVPRSFYKPLIISASVLALVGVGLGVYFGVFYNKLHKNNEDNTPVFHDYSEIHYNYINGQPQEFLKIQVYGNSGEIYKVDWDDGRGQVSPDVTSGSYNEFNSNELKYTANIKIYGNMQYFNLYAVGSYSYTLSQIDKVVYGNNVKQVYDTFNNGYYGDSYYGSGLKEVYISDKVKQIDSDAFQYCTSLTTAYIGDGVRALPSSCFRYCMSLTNVRLNDKITSINSYCFNYCSSLNEIKLPSNLQYIGSSAFAYSNIDSVEFSPKLSTIETSAFLDCHNLKNIKFPHNCALTELNYAIFENCSSLESINIPASISDCYGSIFSGCTSLKKVTFAPNSKITSIEGSFFLGCSSLESIELPNGITEIGSYAFQGCTSLKSVVMPDRISGGFGTYCFAECYNLENFNLPISFNYIRSYCFAECYSIKSIVIPSSVSSIYSNAFDQWKPSQSIKCIGCASAYDITNKYDSDCLNGCNALILDGTK